MGMGGGSSSVDTTTVKTPTEADASVQSTYVNARKRYASSGTSSTILTSGSGDTAAVSTAKKTLLGD